MHTARSLEKANFPLFFFLTRSSFRAQPHVTAFEGKFVEKYYFLVPTYCVLRSLCLHLSSVSIQLYFSTVERVLVLRLISIFSSSSCWLGIRVNKTNNIPEHFSVVFSYRLCEQSLISLTSLPTSLSLCFDIMKHGYLERAKNQR